jgi:two-component system sensor histidine kinase/response regulator
VPILAMTAHAMAEERQRCVEAGMQDHVTKPIDPDALYRTLAAWCRPRAALQMAEAVPADAATSEIPVLEGLDTVTGLKRVAGNRRLYRKLLRQYVDEQSQAAQVVRESLRAGDRKTAERVAHTAKGVSGNIGADDVAVAAGALEQAIVAGRETDALIEHFDATLRAVTLPLASALNGNDAVPAAAAAIVHAERLGPALQGLARLLAASSGKALAFLASEEALLKPALGTAFVTLEKAVHRFDFDSALEELKSSAARHNIALQEGIPHGRATREP